MARSFSNVKTVSSFIGNQISAAVSRRSYSAASHGGAATATSNRVVGGPNMILKKGSEKAAGESAWVPDPITGYYRPESKAKEMDPVELRAMLIRSKNNAK